MNNNNIVVNDNVRCTINNNILIADSIYFENIIIFLPSSADV
jgi:hypothetical protein